MLPKGFHRIRYYGLYATCKAKKVKEALTGLMVALGRLIKGTYRITARHTYRERVLASTGRDPLRCVCCGRDMILWQVWHPRYGVVYDELQAIKRGRYGPCRRLHPGAGTGREGDTPMTQLALLPPVAKCTKTTGLKMYQGQFWANFRRGEAEKGSAPEADVRTCRAGRGRTATRLP